MSLEDGLFDQRVARIREIEALGYSPFGKRFDFTHQVPEILRDYSAKSAEELGPQVPVRVAGRVMTKRPMGKAGFLHIQQGGEKLQRAKFHGQGTVGRVPCLERARSIGNFTSSETDRSP